MTEEVYTVEPDHWRDGWGVYRSWTDGNRGNSTHIVSYPTEERAREVAAFLQSHKQEEL